MCESFGAENSVDPLDIVVYKEDPNDGPTSSSSLKRENLESLGRRIFIKEVRLDMLLKKKPTKLDEEAYGKWKKDYDRCLEGLTVLKDALSGEYPEKKREPSSVIDFESKPIEPPVREENGVANLPPERVPPALIVAAPVAIPSSFPPFPESDTEDEEVVFE